MQWKRDSSITGSPICQQGFVTTGHLSCYTPFLAFDAATGGGCELAFAFHRFRSFSTGSMGSILVVADDRYPFLVAHR